MKCIVSCSGKFHAFALAEQLQKHKLLGGLYTTYAWQKNQLMRRFAKRLDREIISPELIHSNIPLAVLIKSIRNEYLWNEMFDQWVAYNLKKRSDFDALIGWSGMSLQSIRSAKKKGKISILERGSSHIEYQNLILKEEYKKYGLEFSIDPRVIEKEIKEYEECDFISIPSNFVKKTFLDKGYKSEKLIVNAYGVALHFQGESKLVTKNKFRLLYLGALTHQKGLIYLFRALGNLKIHPDLFEIWFVGGISEEIEQEVNKYVKGNWKFFGHIPQQDLPSLISQCDVGIMPSVQDGFGMVLPQMLACGVPVIATTNTGGENIIKEGETGFIVPIRSPDAITDKIQFLYENPGILELMKSKAADSVKSGFTWDDYGQRYVQFLNQLTLPSKV